MPKVMKKNNTSNRFLSSLKWTKILGFNCKNMFVDKDRVNKEIVEKIEENYMTFTYQKQEGLIQED